MIQTLSISIKHSGYTDHMIFQNFNYPNKTYTLIFKVKTVYGFSIFLIVKRQSKQNIFKFIVSLHKTIYRNYGKRKIMQKLGILDVWHYS